MRPWRIAAIAFLLGPAVQAAAEISRRLALPSDGSNVGA